MGLTGGSRPSHHEHASPRREMCCKKDGDVQVSTMQLGNWFCLLGLLHFSCLCACNCCSQSLCSHPLDALWLCICSQDLNKLIRKSTQSSLLSTPWSYPWRTFWGNSTSSSVMSLIMWNQESHSFIQKFKWLQSSFTFAPSFFAPL